MLLIRLVERKWLLNSTTSCEGNNKIMMLLSQMRRERCRNQLPRALLVPGAHPVSPFESKRPNVRCEVALDEAPGTPPKRPSSSSRFPGKSGTATASVGSHGWDLTALLFFLSIVKRYFHVSSSEARNSHMGKGGRRRKEAAGSMRRGVPTGAGRTPASPKPAVHARRYRGASSAHTDRLTDAPTPQHTWSHRPPSPRLRQLRGRGAPSRTHRVAQRRLLAKHRVPHGRGRRGRSFHTAAATATALSAALPSDGGSGGRRGAPARQAPAASPGAAPRNFSLRLAAGAGSPSAEPQEKEDEAPPCTLEGRRFQSSRPAPVTPPRRGRSPARLPALRSARPHLWTGTLSGAGRRGGGSPPCGEGGRCGMGLPDR